MNDTEFFSKLSDDFLNALGQNKTIEHLYMNGVLANAGQGLVKLANACAMNKKKNGSLKYLGINKTSHMGSNNNFNKFFEGFKISERDHELWYGETKLAKEMEGDDLVKHYHCGLEFIDMAHNPISNQTPVFNYKDTAKLPNPVWPKFVEFMNESNLHTLNLSNC